VLTAFCSPKPFTNEATFNQLNTLRAWRAIYPELEIIVFGSSPGAVEAAVEVKGVHIPDIECSSTGAPSFNSMASYANQYGKYDLQVYFNCDILVDQTILSAITMAREQFHDFLLIGERLDISEGATIDVRDPDWKDSLTSLISGGFLVPHGHTGADYFGYRRSIWEELPPVFMGRAMCDHALIHYCLRKNIPVIDATLAVLNIHQFHSYKHVKGDRQEVFQGVDYKAMSQHHGLHHSVPTIADANWYFTASGEIKANKDRQRFFRKLELRMRYGLRLSRVALVFRALQYLIRKNGVMPKKITMDSIVMAWNLNISE
jgi:hypothetical protein